MTIYGEYVSGSAHAAVRISRLGREDCDLTFAAPQPALGAVAAFGPNPVLGPDPVFGPDPVLDKDLVLWIGAIGPLAIIAQAGPATARRVRRLTARFAQPLEPAILAHFATSAVSSALSSAIAGTKTPIAT